MPGKKKATGMSTRQSFLDRNVIAENNAIMRFNEDIENAARGISRPRGPAHDRSREGSRGRSARPPAPARSAPPVRPPALLPEQEAALRATVAAATDNEAVASAGAALVGSLARGDRFERAGDAGWRTLAEGAAAGERSLQQWDQLRLAWTAVRRAALTEWVKIHPDAAALQEKEEKAAARTERAATRRLTPRRSRPRRPPSGVPGERKDAAAQPGEGQPGVVDGPEPADPPAGRGVAESRRRPRRRRPRQPASRPGPVEGTPAEHTRSEGMPTAAAAAAPVAPTAVDAASPRAIADDREVVLPLPSTWTGPAADPLVDPPTATPKVASPDPPTSGAASDAE